MPAAGQARQGALSRRRDAHDGGLRPQGTPPARNGGVGDITRRGRGGQGRTELVQVLAALEVDEFGQREASSLDGLRRGAGDREEEALVGIRDLAVVVPVHDDHPDGVIGHHEGHDGQGPEPVRFQRRVDVGTQPPKVLERLCEERDAVAQHRAAGLQRGEHRIDRFVGAEAETAQCVQPAALAGEGEGGGIDVQLVTQHGEDGVGDLSRVGRRGKRGGHGLHALGRLGRDPPAPFVPRLRTRRPQLHVALAPEVGDPHRHRRGGQLGHHAQCVVSNSP